MDYTIDKNKIHEDDEHFEELQFKYNFINTPWDDRSRKSKIGIVTLLVAMFAVTMALVINNFIMHYKNYVYSRNEKQTPANYSTLRQCAQENMKQKCAILEFYGLIHRELDFRCKKGFPIKVIEPLYHDGVVSNRLVLLFSYENMVHCSKPIQIGGILDWDAKVIIISRQHRMARTLYHQYVTSANQELGSYMKHLNKENMLCVKDLAMCPVQAGDLLLQRGHLFGIAARSIQRSGPNQLACFADLDILKRELKELDEYIDIGHAGNESRRPVKL